MKLYCDINTESKDYNDEFDITIHCNSLKEQQETIAMIKNGAVIISKIKEEIRAQLRLPRYEHEEDNFDDGLQHISNFIDKLIKNN